MSRKKLAVFFALLAFAAGLVWLAGYNFDERNIFVAWFTLVAVMLAAMAADIWGR